ncbi:membrane fusion protein, copper/silver efflux system [Gammaproteobacteria bacterium]
MKPGRKFTVGGLGIMIIAILAAGSGYWVGNQTALRPEAPISQVAAPTNVSKQQERAPLYYRNPMGLSDTSPTPKKDPMGMEYIPVYPDNQADEPAAAHQIKISTDKVQKLGVRIEAAGLHSLDRIVRATGRIEPDERHVYAISPKFDGYIDHLHVNITGQAVSKGQALFEVYSPELVSAQREYAIASQGIRSFQGADSTTQSGMRQLADSSLARLKNWDISAEQVQSLAKSGKINHTLTFRSPVSGIVTEKKAVQGMRFMAGEVLYQIADLSTIWVIADVFEQDIGLVKSGTQAKITINAYPSREFQGTITYVYPTLKIETRTVPIRIELANPEILLKPGMFAQVELPITGKGAVVTVPISAVIDSGTRQIVLLQAKEGRYEPRAVKLGARNENYVEVIEGVKDGDSVVVSANFLIDAESNLQAAIGGFGNTAHDHEKTAVSNVSSTAGSVRVEHQAEGTVDEIDATAGTVSIRHGPIASLKWPAMTMEFQLANDALRRDLKPGTTVSFEFVERGTGEWVITRISPSTAAGVTPPPSPTGH